MPAEMRDPASTDRQASRFIGHAGTYAFGNIARRIVGFVMLPIYTRYLTPAEYGVIGLLTFALALFEPIFGARLARAVPKFYFEATDARSKRAVIWGGLILTAAVSAITMLVLILGRGIGSEWLFGNRRYAFALGLFAVNLLSQPIEQTGMTYIRLQGRSRLFVTMSMAKLLLQVGLNLLFVVWWREGVVGVVKSGVISSLVFGLTLIAFVAIYERPAFDWHLTRRMVGFAWPLWLSGIAGLYTGSSGAMYLRVFGTLSDVGRLELALKFSATVGMLVWGPFSQHWEPMSFRYYREERGRLKFQVAFITISAMMLVIGLGVSILAAPVIRIMASKPFHSAAVIVPLLTFGLILNSLRTFFNFSFIVTDHTKIHTLCQYATAIIVTVAYLALVPKFGLVGAAWAQCVGFSAGFILTRAVSRRYFDPGFNLVPLARFSLIGLAAYLISNVVFGHVGFVSEVIIKSSVLVIAVALIAMIAVRTIRDVDASSLESLPWPLCKLVR